LVEAWEVLILVDSILKSISIKWSHPAYIHKLHPIIEANNMGLLNKLQLLLPPTTIPTVTNVILRFTPTSILISRFIEFLGFLLFEAFGEVLVILEYNNMPGNMTKSSQQWLFHLSFYVIFSIMFIPPISSASLHSLPRRFIEPTSYAILFKCMFVTILSLVKWSTKRNVKYL